MRYAGTTIFGPSDYRVILADWTNIKGPFTNTTPWGKTKNYDDYNLTSGFMTPSILNVTLPTIRAVSCSLALHRLTVNTTYAFSASDRTWNPTTFDRATLANRSSLNASALPSFLRPYATSANGTALLDFADITTNRPGRLQSAALWPTRGSPLNFFELLAAHAQYDLGALPALLDADAFAPAVRTMFTAYTAEMLTELRGAAAAGARAAGVAPGGVPARLRFRESRVVQDVGSTVALEVLLAVVAACFAWVFVRFPSQALLPRSPGSVAARMALVAGSGLVGRLREGGVRGVGEGNGEAEAVWRERAGLGWWEEVRGGARVDGGERRMRWGIDVGEGVVRRSWNHPPAVQAPVEIEMGPVASGRSSASLMSRRGEEELGPALSRRSSVSSMSRRSSSASSGVTIISE
ncbi:hypothetical protein GTA08_BOTSDO04895 [Neofusicoccum parvum]|uniref:Uncharacterized protein n=1 Tax=Neofusicoccum parvum TaxID=310453 RepID=A0ACB5SK72_9PEZI|nr:hypothetical protein GTA08_BOTSDO04895 [Neofusicoccum parvum]